MRSFISFDQFIRKGGHQSIVLDLRSIRSAPEVKQARLTASSLDRFEDRLRALAEQNWSVLLAAFRRAEVVIDPEAENVDAEVARFRAEFDAQAAPLLGGDASAMTADIVTLSDWLARRFLTEINERRQRALGVSHYIWRSLDDDKVRTIHAERDDRLFSWDDRFSDGHPGHGYNCRCSAEPAILDGAILLTDVTLSEGLSDRIADAQGEGLADAAAQAAAGGAQSLYSAVRFSWLGYRRFFGLNTPEEEAERLALRDSLIRAVEMIAALDAETARGMADAFVQYFEARHSDLRLLDLEHRLGLIPEGTLLRAYREVAYLDASATLGATTVATVAAQLGIGLARLRPRAAIATLRASAARYDGLFRMRRATVNTYVSQRFAVLERQGHGPQRHEGAVTRQMLEDRVLRGIDPMTGTRQDGVTGGRHFQPAAASRFTSPEAFVAAEGFVRRTPQYRDFRETALYDLTLERRFFQVALPIKDVLGRDFRSAVEGVVRRGSRSAPQGTEAMDFEGGLVIAWFKFILDGEPELITLYPVGRNK